VPAGYVVDNTDCNDANAAVHPGAIDVCNGVDDDCNAATADGSGESWIDQSTACGVGVCASTGNYVCQAGLKTNTCKEGTPAASDLTCNGLDDDCNGKIDDEYVSLPTTCGVGACAATGIKTCVAGAEQNSCTQGSSTGSDDNCNGIDENCNGVPDDNYVSTSTSCGVGACASSGQLICSNGATQDTCTPGISKPEVWNGLDDDCNGKIDDGIANPDCAATLFKDGWANCAVSGNNYGDIGLSCCRVAWDGVNKPCTELNRDATFTVGTDGLLTTKIVIDHLDGIADTGDGFEVKDGDTVLCSYVGTLPGTEIWKTLTCDVNLIGVKTLTIHPTATSPWTQCDTYGQVAINSITFETAPAPTDVDFKIGDTCPATWGVPAIPGGTYGGKPYTDFCLVWEPTCAAGTESASVNMEFSGVPNELITIEHLDGMSDKDSFDVLVDNVKAGHYTDSGLSIEDWVTTSFPVTVTPGIHTVTLKATDSAWSSCNDWGQIAIDSIKVEGACNLIASYRDSDGDGYGNNVVSSLACTVPAGYVVDNTDCNDANAAVHPGAKDVCNGVDDDCTAATADGSAESWYNQATTCGLGVCAATGNYVCQLGVKTDTCVVGAPTGTDNNCNGVDENCDGTADNAYVPASTTCGTGACAATGTTSCVSGSVQDTCKPGSPTAETCNGLDDDCNGVVDDGLTAPTQSCSVGVGACMNTGTQIKTCNRVNGWSNWGACSAIAGTPGIETCNGIDDDCNSVIDNGVKTTFYRDADSDGYGNPTVKIQACSAPSGYVASKTDCNDANAAIHPGAAEVCNGIDDNCNGLIDDGLTKSASNIQGLCSGNTQTCKAGIWKDTSTNYKPTAEICDNKDNNCNGLVDDGLTRTTHCGLGICSSNTGKETCIAGTWGGNTCNAFAGATTEICDDKDNNCNGKIDESPCTAATYCGNIIIKNMVDISGMLKCQTADWQHNEPGRLPNDCSVHLISSSKVVCVATSNAN